MSSDATGPNAQQIAYWNEITGPRWVAQQAELDSELAPPGQAALARSGVATRDRVLDIGCGCGQTLLDLGERVGSDGKVLGIDISSPMLGRAMARVRERGFDHVDVLQADAQTHAFTRGGFDHVFSRFGVMFFADPTAAFANLHRALAPDGQLTFVCWQPAAANAWMAIPTGAASAHLALPTPAAPGAPGPFSFADTERVRGILQAAGFREIEFESVERDLHLGDDVAAAAELCLQMGPMSAALRLASERGEVVDIAAVRASIETALAPFERAEGVRMPSASWLVRACA